jgi:hypothetical protein
VAIIFLALLVWRLANLAKYSGWYDREYLLLSNRWSYSLGKDGDSLDAECIAERDIISHDTMNFMTFSVSKDEAFLPFEKTNKYSAEIVQIRRENGNATVLPPHKKEGASFAFRVRFTPSLRNGERLYLVVKFNVPGFKTSNIEDLRERMKKATIDARDYEINSFPINYPTRKFKYEIYFDSTCKVRLSDFEVTRGQVHFLEEEKYVLDHGLYKAVGENGKLRATIEREYPPLKARYKLKWKPPHKSDISRA